VYAITNQLTTVGYIADSIQFLLEIIGRDTIGKIIGALGNIGASAIAGATVGGPLGLLYGSVKGIVRWLIGEVIWDYSYWIICAYWYGSNDCC